MSKLLNRKPNYTPPQPQTSPQFAFVGARQPERIAIRVDEFNATTKIAKITAVGLVAGMLASLEIIGTDIYGSAPTELEKVGVFDTATPAQITVNFSNFNPASQKIQLRLRGYSTTLNRLPNEGSIEFDFQTAIVSGTPKTIFDYRVSAT